MKSNDFVLTDKQKMLLDELAPVMTENCFYLAGGTAIALHLGHRRSMDFDWFTTNPIPDALQLAKIIQESEPTPVLFHDIKWEIAKTQFSNRLSVSQNKCQCKNG